MSQALITTVTVGRGWRFWTDGDCSDSGRDALTLTLEAMQCGAGKVIATSIHRNCTGEGLDLPLIRVLAGGLSVVLIAARGFGLAKHCAEGYHTSAASVAAGPFSRQQ